MQRIGRFGGDWQKLGSLIAQGPNHLGKILQQYCSPPGWQRVIHHPWTEISSTSSESLSLSSSS